MVIHETRETDVIRKALLVILASVAVAQASAEEKGVLDRGNEWLFRIEAENLVSKAAARAYLLGLDDIHWLTGLAGDCVPAPDGVTQGQIEALVIKWLENNPDQRHQFMPIILHSAKKEAWGSYPLPTDKPIC